MSKQTTKPRVTPWPARVSSLLRSAKRDPDPVSMFTEEDHSISVVVLKGPKVIEMFRQWAERNRIYERRDWEDDR